MILWAVKLASFLKNLVCVLRAKNILWKASLCFKGFIVIAYVLGIPDTHRIHALP